MNPTFVERIQQGDSGSEDANSPRNVMNQFYFRPPFRVVKEEEDAFVESMLTTRIGEGFYPGGFVPSKNWPGTAPGEDGIANAMSPKYVNLAGIAEVHKPFPILWVRGNEDQIVSDLSMFDLGTLGKFGLVPGWPGNDVFPPQPMVTQTRKVLEKYRTNGGWFEELVVKDAGHSPHIERPDVVWPAMRDFLCNQVGREFV
ncbi:alpha/beta hydrolase [Alicyclobacillaceae bacterium I2511]|nr:alpha/beta hydrolase [Alicyclobacillaceae bacterium I2511]